MKEHVAGFGFKVVCGVPALLAAMVVVLGNLISVCLLIAVTADSILCVICFSGVPALLAALPVVCQPCWLPCLWFLAS